MEGGGIKKGGAGGGGGGGGQPEYSKLTYHKQHVSCQQHRFSDTIRMRALMDACFEKFICRSGGVMCIANTIAPFSV